MHHCRSGDDLMEKSSPEKNLGILVEKRLAMSQWYTVDMKVNGILWCNTRITSLNLLSFFFFFFLHKPHFYSCPISSNIRCNYFHVILLVT